MSAPRAAAARRATVGAACLLVFASGGMARADDNGIADDSPGHRPGLARGHGRGHLHAHGGPGDQHVRHHRSRSSVRRAGQLRRHRHASRRRGLGRHRQTRRRRLDEARRRPAESPGTGPRGEDAIALINGRYLHGTTDSVQLREFAQLCDLDFFKKEFSSKPPSEQLVKGSRTTVDGRPPSRSPAGATAGRARTRSPPRTSRTC